MHLATHIKRKDDDSTVATVASSESTAKSLRFALEANEVFPIAHISDMKYEEVMATWYDAHDFDRMKNKMVPLVRKIMSGETVEETKKQTTRGLEFRHREGALRREDNKKDAAAAVLGEQKRQRRKKIHDIERIADAYRKASSHCQEEAHSLALEDEKAVEGELQEMRTTVPTPTRGSNSKSKSLGLNRIFKQVRLRTMRSLDKASRAQKEMATAA